MERNTILIKNLYICLTIWLFLIISLSNIFLYFIFYKTTINNELEQLSSKSEQIVEALISSNYNNFDKLLINSVPINGAIRVVDEKGDSIITVVTGIDSMYERTFKREKTSEIETIDGIQYAVIYIPMVWRDGRVVSLELVESLEPLQRNIAELKPFLTGVSLVILFSIIPLVLLVRRQLI